ncbi:DJ-1/PfpI family protein [Deferribacterales bacterium RsTz2092]|nr:4-methyl-5(B-hydroxyethyl)-thiazole monophosphate biosynthesis protein [Deferribacterales bacterium]
MTNIIAPKVLVVLADGFEEIEALAPIDLLRRAGLDVTTASIDKADVLGSHNVSVKADVLLADVMNNIYDMVVLPGGGLGTENLSKSPLVAQLVYEQEQSKRYLAAICAAPTVLNKQGVFDKNILTSHPSVQSSFNQARYRTDSVVVSDKVITSRGAGTAVEFALKLVETLCDKATADNVAQAIVYK